MGKVVKLPPANGIQQSRRGVYREYVALRNFSPDFRRWMARQFDAQHGLCFYCERPLKDRKMNVEHKQSIRHGGTNKARNLVLACWECNKLKGSKRLRREGLANFKARRMRRVSDY